MTPRSDVFRKSVPNPLISKGANWIPEDYEAMTESDFETFCHRHKSENKKNNR
jgi:hypothetical protein